MRKILGLTAAACCAGVINGLLGAGGGTVLVPMLTWLTEIRENEVFPLSVSLILPICIVSLMITGLQGTLSAAEILPYLTGSAAGGFLAGKLGQKLRVKWLHTGLGMVMLWGGIRYLC